MCQFHSSMFWRVVLQHRLEIMIDHRLESVGASDAILPIIIGC